MPVETIKLFLYNFLELYKWLMFARIALSWLPGLNWQQPPLSILNDITEPVMKPFRTLIPPIGGIDLSPIVVFFVIGLLQGLLRSMG
ncbi:MAG: YggT family protein [Vampirovibrionales bacterium]|nr:YggT family protein [Vampirovibrionales bacterium]